MDNKSKKRPLAVVTGASDGIGYELAKVFAQKGYDLVICAEDKGIVEAAQAFEGLGAKVTSVQADLARFEGVEKLWRELDGIPIDAIAINAGVGVNGDFARETDLRDELNLIQLNVVSSVHLAKRVLKGMVARGEGKVLFTSSVVSTMPAPYLAIYGASKAFVQSFAEAIREELKDTGVTVTALMPGATDTNFFRRADMEDTKVGASEKDDPADVALQGFEALMSGKDHVVAGSFKNKVQVAGGKVMSEPTKAKIHAGMAKPGSASE